jgi:nucleotide-binding universal stress UspA family protein
MKSILVHADSGPGMAARLDTAFAIARASGGHVTLLINTPFQRFVAMDPFGGAYLAAGALAEAQARDAALEAKLSADLANEDVPWDIIAGDGDLVAALASASALADLSIVSMVPASAERFDASPMLAGDLALASRAPVLTLPDGAKPLDMVGPVLLGWNGSAEAATALRAAVPLLAGRQLVLLRVGDTAGKFPDTSALKYLARHGVSAELREIAASGRSVEEELEAAAIEMQAAMIVMGAFGHSRLRETLFGGVTRYLLDSARIPLLMAH